MKKNGFSLIEILVTMSVVTMIGVIAANILSNSFKGNTKSELIGTIKQNAQTALATIENDIKSSDVVLCPATSATVLALTSKTDGQIVRYIIMSENGSSIPNGYIAREQLVYTTPVITPESFCNLAIIPENIQGTRNYIIDYSTTSGVALKYNSSFIVTHAVGYKDVVRVIITLGPSKGKSPNVENTLGSAGLTFDTTIQLR